MIASFGDKTSRDLYNGLNTKQARRLPKELHSKAQRLFDQINAALTIRDLEIPPGNKLERLKRDLKAYHSVRINDQWRIIFIWKDSGVENIKTVDYHKG